MKIIPPPPRKLSLIKLITTIAIASCSQMAEAAPFAYVTNHNTQVNVIDLATNTLIQSITTGQNPWDVAITPDGNHAYVTNSGNSGANKPISIIDTATNTKSGDIGPFGNNFDIFYAEDITLSPGGDYAYVTTGWEVYQLFTSTNTVNNTPIASSVSIGGGSLGSPVFTPNGAYAYVLSRSFPKVLVIDTHAQGVVATITLDNIADSLAVTPDGAYVYATNNYTTFTNGSVYVINTASNTVTNTISVGAGAKGIAISPNGSRAYVANYFDNTVSVIDTGSNTVIATIPVGRGAWGVAITSDGKKVYVTEPTDHNISVIDTASNSVTGTVDIASSAQNAYEIAITPMPITPPNTTFSGFSAKLNVALGTGAYSMNSTLTLGSATNGISPLTEDVTIGVGNSLFTIPTGSFTRNKKGLYVFNGVISTTSLAVQIQPLGGNQYSLKASAQNVSLSGTANPVTVNIAIGDDSGSISVQAKFQ